MFKKSLVAVAVLGAAAFSAQAADVQLYGVIDYGFNWTNTKTDSLVDNTTAKTDSFGLQSGQNSGSRFGLKGTEDLGNGYKVGFVLENGFKADDGALEKGGRLFHREALLYVQSAWGELSAGRTGALDAGTGRYNLMGSGATAMGTGWDQVGVSTIALMGTNSRMDNTLTYKSPNFAGFTVYAQASLKTDSVDEKYKKDVEGSSDANRYYGLGVTYNLGALNAGFVASQTDYKRDTFKDGNAKADDAQAYSAFVNYDLGFVKPMFAVQYWDGGKNTLPNTEVPAYTFADHVKGANTKGYGLVVGATAPVFGGTLKATAGWNDYEFNEELNAGEKATDGNNLMLGVGYEYPLSKRTLVYTAAGYSEKAIKDEGFKAKEKITEAMVGLVHKF